MTQQMRKVRAPACNGFFYFDQNTVFRQLAKIFISQSIFNDDGTVTIKISETYCPACAVIWEIFDEGIVYNDGTTNKPGAAFDQYLDCPFTERWVLDYEEGYWILFGCMSFMSFYCFCCSWKGKHLWKNRKFSKLTEKFLVTFSDDIYFLQMLILIG